MAISILPEDSLYPGETVVGRYIYAHRKILETPLQSFRRPKGPKGGRPPIGSLRIVEAAIWICLSRGKWMDLSYPFPSGKTVHRRFSQWRKDGSWNQLLWLLASETPAGVALDLQRCFHKGQVKRGLSFEEVRSLVEAPVGRDMDFTWLALLFISPFGAERERLGRSDGQTVLNRRTRLS